MPMAQAMFGKPTLTIAFAPAFILASCTPYDAPADAKARFLKDQQAWTQACEDWDEWDKPAPPYRIHNGTYYVGTCGIAVILIAGDDGHVLIDTGTKAGADVVKANIQSLGFDLQDIRVILHSHEHHDHVGGLAKMKQWTGADVLASVDARKAIETGQSSVRDPQHGRLPEMDPVQISGTVTDGDHVTGGTINLTAIETPGHTPGALSWQWSSCTQALQDDCASIVYADSLSPISADDYRFSDHPDYVARFRKGLERLSQVECTILLTPHPSASKMPERLASDQGLIDPTLCANYAEGRNTRLDNRLAKEIETE